MIVNRGLICGGKLGALIMLYGVMVVVLNSNRSRLQSLSASMGDMAAAPVWSSGETGLPLTNSTIALNALSLLEKEEHKGSINVTKT